MYFFRLCPVRYTRNVIGEDWYIPIKNIKILKVILRKWKQYIYIDINNELESARSLWKTCSVWEIYSKCSKSDRELEKRVLFIPFMKQLY